MDSLLLPQYIPLTCVSVCTVSDLFAQPAECIGDSKTAPEWFNKSEIMQYLVRRVVSELRTLAWMARDLCFVYALTHLCDADYDADDSGNDDANVAAAVVPVLLSSRSRSQLLRLATGGNNRRDALLATPLDEESTGVMVDGVDGDDCVTLSTLLWRLLLVLLSLSSMW